MQQIIRSKKDLRKAISRLKMQHKTIGLVPTMGALHAGHLSLVKLATQQYDCTIVTLFVNPTQFNNARDLQTYPRTEQDDLALLSQTGCDIVFVPTEQEMYGQKPVLSLHFGHLEQVMEGQHRPGHFSGVGLVVMKLFSLVQPTGAFFGQKDLQQFRVITQMVADFDLPVRLHMAPIIREANGLAMSSRNKRLSATLQQEAAHLHRALVLAQTLLSRGTSVPEALQQAITFIEDTPNIQLEYFEAVDFETLKRKSSVSAGDTLALCLAAHLGGVRLIDNVIFEA